MNGTEIWSVLIDGWECFQAPAALLTKTCMKLTPPPPALQQSFLYRRRHIQMLMLSLVRGREPSPLSAMQVKSISRCKCHIIIFIFDYYALIMINVLK